MPRLRLLTRGTAAEASGVGEVLLASHVGRFNGSSRLREIRLDRPRRNVPWRRRGGTGRYITCSTLAQHWCYVSRGETKPPRIPVRPCRSDAVAASLCARVTTGGRNGTPRGCLPRGVVVTIEDGCRFYFRLAGTFAPFRRASESPMATACLRLVTFLPLRPLFNVPRFRLLIVRSTDFCAARPYRAMVSSSLAE